MAMADAALAVVRNAVSRVLDVDPGVLRADTPLADLGCDPVALLAIVDLLAEDVPGADGGALSVEALEAHARGAVTVGDLVPVHLTGRTAGP